MSGILAYGAYVPRYRLAREAISVPPAAGTGAETRGTRAVAGYDEDTTSMGIEAARVALGGHDLMPDALYLATTSPAYGEKNNSTLIHSVLGLDRSVPAIDCNGSFRSAAGALHIGLFRPARSLVVSADVRTSKPGGADERDAGDAASALLVTSGKEPVIAEVLATASLTMEFLDRWRVGTEAVARTWEERFGMEVYHDLGREALAAAMKKAGITAADIKHVVVASPNTRALRSLPKALKLNASDDFVASVGNTGSAHAGLRLADVLDRASPGETIAVICLADGADVTLLRTTELLTQRRAPVPVAALVAKPAISIGYTKFLEWRGMLATEPPRRPDPLDPAAPTTLRINDWKLRYTGSRCKACGEQHYPPQRVCQQCRSVDLMEAVRPKTGAGTVVTSVVDRLAWSPHPPLTMAVVDLDGGGRVQTEVTEVDGLELGPGSRVELTFRRLYTTRNGIHNYFWKMRPASEGRAA
jgi:hydroxymethylglutaryl-CoA synthase